MENYFETAGKFERAFQSVFIKKLLHDAPNFDFNYSGPKTEGITVDLNTVENILKTLNVNKAKGPDGIL